MSKMGFWVAKCPDCGEEWQIWCYFNVEKDKQVWEAVNFTRTNEDGEKVVSCEACGGVSIGDEIPKFKSAFRDRV